MKKALERLYNGIIKENPTFVLMLGMCPTLAVTTSAINGLGMGLSTCAVLMMSNLIISLLRKVIPSRVRMPAYIVIVASLVTVVELLMQAFVRSLYASLGLFIPLIVVNCIILGRAEAYASKNPPLPSLFDGLGMGIGFTIALTLIGSFRELLGKGSIFGFEIMPSFYEPVSIMIMAPGAFFVLAGLSALQNKIRQSGKKPAPDKYCGGNCASCLDSSCSIGKKEEDKEE
ncbi:MAG: electron transport complex subunit E [Clostridia bacterium]|nr:electron transport complex subunit E [Clostridia bacterium]